jgi:hypothetical protein
MPGQYNQLFLYLYKRALRTTCRKDSDAVISPHVL